MHDILHYMWLNLIFFCYIFSFTTHTVCLIVFKNSTVHFVILKKLPLNFNLKSTTSFVSSQNNILTAKKKKKNVTSIREFKMHSVVSPSEIGDPPLPGPVYIFQQASKTCWSMQEALFDWQNKRNQRS